MTKTSCSQEAEASRFIQATSARGYGYRSSRPPACRTSNCMNSGILMQPYSFNRGFTPRSCPSGSVTAMCKSHSTPIRTCCQASKALQPKWRRRRSSVQTQRAKVEKGLGWWPQLRHSKSMVFKLPRWCLRSRRGVTKGYRRGSSAIAAVREEGDSGAVSGSTPPTRRAASDAPCTGTAAVV